MRSLELPKLALCFQKLAGTTSWDFDNECRREQRQYLVTNQAECCAWCEKSILLDSSHMDHVISRHEDSSRTFDHANIVASCGSNSGVHCGHARSRNSLPKELDLYTTGNIQQHFDVQIDGTLKVESSTLHNTTADKLTSAINDELKLNISVLKSKRERRLAELNEILNGGLTTDELQDIYAEADFPSLTEQVCVNHK